jgi:hypothetical protein
LTSLHYQFLQGSASLHCQFDLGDHFLGHINGKPFALEFALKQMGAVTPVLTYRAVFPGAWTLTIGNGAVSNRPQTGGPFEEPRSDIIRRFVGFVHVCDYTDIPFSLQDNSDFGSISSASDRFQSTKMRLAWALFALESS